MRRKEAVGKKGTEIKQREENVMEEMGRIEKERRKGK